MSLDSVTDNQHVLLTSEVLANIETLTLEGEFGDDQKQVKQNFIAFTILLSLVLHVTFSLVFYNSVEHLQWSSDTQNKEKLQTYLSVKLQTSAKLIQQAITESTNSRIVPSQVKPPEIKQSQIQASQLTPKSVNDVQPEEEKINYATLTSSIQNFIEQDRQDYEDKLFNRCELTKARKGQLDCMTSSERLGFKQKDSFQLAQIFKRLDKNPNSKKKQRIIATLRLKEKQLNKILSSNNLPNSVKELFREELAFLRGELHFQDCDGKPGSGTCAGEINLFKIAELLNLLVTKSYKSIQ